MKQMITIFRRELRAYFDSPLAYIVIVAFLLVTGWFFATNVFVVAQADMRIAFGVIPFIFLFFTPALTMRLVAEERKSGTLELLTTLPISDASIILGKYLAALVLLSAAVIPTILYAIVLGILGDVDTGATIAGYIGLILLGGSYLAIGTFGSSLTDNQVIAFIISFFLIFLFFLLDKILFLLPNWIVTPVEFLAVEKHFQNISRGVIDSRDIVYFLSLMGLFLFLATRSLVARRLG
ncbi:MAG: ABC transporter permease [bacterium]